MKSSIKKNLLFNQLLHLMVKLRSEDGCPWDREQTFDSLKIHIIEEAYEVVDAINKKSSSQIKEELGDLLFIIIFLSQIASDKKLFSINDVIADSINKMVRRHPHVFGKNPIRTKTSPRIKKAKHAQEAYSIWQSMKKKEKKGSILDDIPLSLPALIKASKLQKQIAKRGKKGLKTSSTKQLTSKIESNVKTLKRLLNVYPVRSKRKTSTETKTKNINQIQESIGKLLFNIVTLSRLFHIECEDALHMQIEKFAKEFKEC